MQINTQTLDGGIVQIELEGRMDIQGTQEIDIRFSGHTANQKAVIVDMAGVSFLASIGIRTLLMTAKAVSGRGGKMVLLNPDANVTKVLEMAGIDSLIPICRSLDEARTAVSS